MIPNIQSFSPPAYQAGGFNIPNNDQPMNTGFNNPANNAFSAIGTNPTMAGANPTTQFNGAAYNPFANDPRTAMLYQSATGQLDPTIAAATLGLKPQIISTGPGGFPMAMGAGMSSMALKIALDAADRGLQMGDFPGFVKIMATMSKDPTASLDPRFQQLVPAYQELMATVGDQSPALTGGATGANFAQAQQMGQIQVMMQQLMEQNKKLMALLSESGIPAEKLNEIMTPTATPTTSTTQQQQMMQALFKNQTDSVA